MSPDEKRFARVLEHKSITISQRIAVRALYYSDILNGTNAEKKK